MFSNSLIIFLNVKILKFLKTESSSRLKVIKFSFVTDLPRADEMYSLFLNNSKNVGTKNVYKSREPLEIR